MDPLARLRQYVHRVPDARRRWLAAALVAVAVLALAVPVGLSVLRHGVGAASTSGTSSTAARGAFGQDSGSGGSATPQTPTEGKALAPGAAADGSGSNGAAAGSVLDALPTDLGVRLARTAWLGVKVGDLAAASGRARVVTSEAGGVVTFENVVTATDPTGRYGAPDGALSPGATGPGTTSPDTSQNPSVETQPVGVDEARMVLSVPADKLDGVLTELSRLGSVSYRSSQTEDVTETYVDAQARVQPARDSITRVRALLAKATDLQQVVLLESELSRRQADLDSLVRRLADLERRTTNSDVTLTLWTAATTPVVAATGDDVASRLRGAWEGLLTSATVIVTGLAALLPWIVVAGLAALVVVRVRRRRAAASLTPALATAGAPASAGPAAPAAAPASAGPAATPSATGTAGESASHASDD
jgi:hypothetical protein